MKTILLLVAIGLAAGPGRAQSYELLEGRRLARFEKTAGGSEAGRLITLHLPAKVLAGAEIGKSRVRGRQSFRWKKVRIEVDGNNSYWRQTLRKLERDSKGAIILKGRMRWHRTKDGGRQHFLLLDSIQKSARRR